MRQGDDTGFVAHEQHRPVVGIVGWQYGAVARLSRQPMCGDYGARSPRLIHQPCGIIVGMDDVDGARGLPAIGGEKGGKIGHWAPFIVRGPPGIVSNAPDGPGRA